MIRPITGLAAIALIALVACDEDQEIVRGTGTLRVFADLSEKSHVLHNLEVAHKRHDETEFERLLDDDFVFFFDDADFRNGKTPKEWGKFDEKAATINLLRGEENRDGTRVTSIDLDVQFAGATWDTVPDAGGPGEDWYRTTVTYIFVMRASNGFSYITDGQPQAQFTVRNAGTDQEPSWRLVRWRDVAHSTLLARSPQGRIEETTWGQLKTLHATDRAFEDFSRMWHTIHNLEKAYVMRLPAEYRRVLDTGFVFFFDPEDHASGKTPEQWPRIVDEVSTGNLLEGHVNRDGNRITSIELDVQYEGAVWTMIPDAGGPGEDWFTTTVNYVFTMRATNDWTYITGGQPKAEFIVRNAGTPESPSWRLVRWYDKRSTLAGGRSASAAAVESTSWGTLKAGFEPL